MASINVVDVNDSNFDRQVLQSSLPVLVHFTASWNGPCKLMAPVIEEIADDFQGYLKVCRFDIDNNNEIPELYGVGAVPTFVLFQNGQKKGEKVGFTTRGPLLSFAGLQ